MTNRPVPTRLPLGTVAHKAFERACFAAARSKDPAQFLRTTYPTDEASLAILERATVAGATTGTAGWAAELVQTAFRAFLTSLAPDSAAAKLIQLGVAARLDGIGSAKYPARSTAPAAFGWVGESGAIPVAGRTLETVTIGPPKKLALITVFSKELADRADGEAVFSQMLREDAAKSIDTAYFATTAGSASAHAGLLNGVSPLTASNAGGAPAVQEDLAALITAVAEGGSGQVVFVMSTARAATFPVYWPDLSEKITVLGSSVVPDARVIAIDPVSLLHATDEAPDIFAGEEATLHMDDAATHISAAGTPNTVAAPVQSMWQTGQLALRVIAFVAFAKRRSAAVAYIDAVDWAAAA